MKVDLDDDDDEATLAARITAVGSIQVKVGHIASYREGERERDAMCHVSVRLSA